MSLFNYRQIKHKKYKNKNNNFESSYLNQFSYQQEDLTLVTAYYRMKSKHTPEEYIKWNQKFCFIK